MPKMKPFTEADWSAFAGCASDEPKIGELIVEAGGLDLDGIVIADGEHVTIDAFLGDDRKYWFVLELFSRQLVELVAKALPDRITEKELLDLGFRSQPVWMAEP